MFNKVIHCRLNTNIFLAEKLPQSSEDVEHQTQLSGLNTNV